MAISDDFGVVGVETRELESFPDYPGVKDGIVNCEISKNETRWISVWLSDRLQDLLLGVRMGKFDLSNQPVLINDGRKSADNVPFIEPLADTVPCSASSVNLAVDKGDGKPDQEEVPPDVLGSNLPDNVRAAVDSSEVPSAKLDQVEEPPEQVDLHKVLPDNVRAAADSSYAPSAKPDQVEGPPEQVDLRKVLPDNVRAAADSSDVPSAKPDQVEVPLEQAILGYDHGVQTPPTDMPYRKSVKKKVAFRRLSCLMIFMVMVLRLQNVEGSQIEVCEGGVADIPCPCPEGETGYLDHYPNGNKRANPVRSYQGFGSWKITDARLHDSGFYRCTCSGEHGNESEIFLQVNGASDCKRNITARRSFADETEFIATTASTGFKSRQLSRMCKIVVWIAAIIVTVGIVG